MTRSAQIAKTVLAVGAVLWLSPAVSCQAPGSDTLREVVSRPVADVVSVVVEGEPGEYRFEVGVESPDKGCRQYADWWEVVDEKGRLIYRRVLRHSHVDEQPFVRAGEPVPVAEDTVVWVRAHMHPTGYGGTALRGSVRDGFEPAHLAPTFAARLDEKPPLPSGCTH